MTVLIRFNTNVLDVSRERPNPINPIFGESLLVWLRERFDSSSRPTEPDVEDWGWYSLVTWNEAKYMLGSSASEPDANGREWILQIVRQRGLKERLLGRGKMTHDDPLVAHIVSLLSSEPRFTGMQVESEV